MADKPKRRKKERKKVDMRKVIYFVAVSADGFIAHADGSHHGWVLEGDHMSDIGTRFPETIPTHWQKQLGIPAENKQFDAVLMGRKTYDIGFQQGITNPYASLKQYVFSRTMTKSPDSGMQLVSDDVAGFVRQLKQANGKDIWLCGGGELAALLLQEGLIDEILLKHHPVLFGSGIPLVNTFGGWASLELLESKRYNSGVLLLNYRIKT